MNHALSLYVSGAWLALDPEVDRVDCGPVIERHLTEYSLSFVHRAAFDQPRFALGTPALLTVDNATVFRGCLTAAERAAEENREEITYRADSWWWAASQFTLKLNGRPRVAYNARRDSQLYDPTRANRTVGQILTDAAALVSASISAFTTTHFGAAWPGIALDAALDVVPPPIELEGRTLQDAIAEALKWMPDAFLRIERDTGRFRFARRSSTTTHTLYPHAVSGAAKAQADSNALASIQLSPRLDLALPRIVLSHPVREETWECWHDPEEPGTPTYLAGIPQTVTQVDAMTFQLSNPVHQVIEVIGPSIPWSVSLASGTIAFRAPIKGFYIRYFAQTGVQTFDTGFGGTAYSDFAKDYGVLERWLDDFPVTTRRMQVGGVDEVEPKWIFLVSFPEAFPWADLWPPLLGKTVTIPGKGSSTITEIARHTFNLIIGGVEFPVLWGIGIKLAAAISGAAVGDWAKIVTEDYTATIAALADSLWLATRDVRREGELPSLAWLPSLEIGHRVNLANTADPTLASMAEPIYELELHPLGTTRLRLAMNRYYGLDDLLAALRAAITPQSFAASSSPGGGDSSGSGTGGVKKHQHHSDTDEDGGDVLAPSRITVGAGTSWFEAVGGNLTGTHADKEYALREITYLDKDGNPKKVKGYFSAPEAAESGLAPRSVMVCVDNVRKSMNVLGSEPT